MLLEQQMIDQLNTITCLEDATAWRLQRLARRLRYSLASSLRAWDTGLSPEQFFILFRLFERDGRALRELTDPLLDDRANITRLVDALVRRGFVERRGDPEDGRVKRVFLTPAGTDFFQQLHPRIIEERGRLFDGVTPEQLDAFETMIDLLNGRALKSS
ncbi:MAG: DNA-binding MarR family transcriptional regulator [Myxococcota bacterium]|jgi:DNA-binding MarR family transcriptional regulator